MQSSENKRVSSKSLESNNENEDQLEARMQYEGDKFHTDQTEINMQKLREITRQKKNLQNTQLNI